MPNPKPMTTEAKLAKAIEALRTIYAGASVAGRWIERENGDAVGHDPIEPDPGYYDADHPPEGYDREGYCGFGDDRPDPETPLIGADWEPFTLEEQGDWLASCATCAHAALSAIGGPVAKSEDASC